MFAETFQDASSKLREEDYKGYSYLVLDYEDVFKRKSMTEEDLEKEGLAASFILASLLGKEKLDREGLGIFMQFLLLMPKLSLQSCVDGLVLQKQRKFLRAYVESVIPPVTQKLINGIEILKELLQKDV